MGVDEFYEVVIVGAGPAGLMCAYELQKAKKRVLILEKNSEVGPKVCAGGLTTKIKNLGFSLEIAEILFSSVIVNVAGVQRFIVNQEPFVGTIERKELGQMMLQRLDPKLIDIRVSHPVVKIGDDYVEVMGQRMGYKHLVAADGSNSLVRSYLGLPTKKFGLTIQYLVPQKFSTLELFFDASLFGCGYAWIFPHQNYTSIGCGQFMDPRHGAKLREGFDRWLSLRGIRVDDGELQGGIINFDYRGFEFGNKFLIGDAGGFASGFTGEGIYPALVSGQEAARKIINQSYRTKVITEILHIKRIHEALFSLCSLFSSLDNSGKLLNNFLRFTSLGFRSKILTKKAIQLFC
ncbi:MAG: FAD-dependent oxidoreductase [Candidatus Pacebacteria bacterium]|nr:FAD-dependent oxidoreductase [Candidatus Paceibacterota bacterium]